MTGLETKKVLDIALKERHIQAMGKVHRNSVIELASPAGEIYNDKMQLYRRVEVN